MKTRARDVVLGALTSGAIGVLVFVGQASASTLLVDGGIIQHWEMPAQLDMVEPAPLAPSPAPAHTPSPVADQSDNSAASADEDQIEATGQAGEDQTDEDAGPTDEDEPGEEQPDEAGSDAMTGDGQSL